MAFLCIFYSQKNVLYLNDYWSIFQNKFRPQILLVDLSHQNRNKNGLFWPFSCDLDFCYRYQYSNSNRKCPLQSPRLSLKNKVKRKNQVPLKPQFYLQLIGFSENNATVIMPIWQCSIFKRERLHALHCHTGCYIIQSTPNFTPTIMTTKFVKDSTDYKNIIENFFEHFRSTLLDPLKSLFGDITLEIDYFKK